MRGSLIAIAGGLIAVGALALARRSAGRTGSHEGSMALRDAVLSRELFKDSPPIEPGTMRAVVFDWNIGNGIATVVAFADGTTSLYLSSGGGVIGAGTHEPVARAAAAFREEAARVVSQFAPTDEFAQPPEDRARYYVVMQDRTLASGYFTSAELQQSGHPFRPLGERAQAVITAIRSTR